MLIKLSNFNHIHHFPNANFNFHILASSARWVQTVDRIGFDQTFSFSEVWGLHFLLKWRENFILQYLHIAIPLSNMELATCSSKLRVCCACDNLGWLVVKALDVMLLKNSDCLQTLAVNALHYTTPQTWQWHHLVHLIWQFYKLLRHWFYALLNAAAI